MSLGWFVQVIVFLNLIVIPRDGFGNGIPVLTLLSDEKGLFV